MTKGQVLRCHQDWGLAVHASLQHQGSPAEREKWAGGGRRVQAEEQSSFTLCHLRERHIMVRFRNKRHFKNYGTRGIESCGRKLQSSLLFAFRPLPHLQLPSAGMKPNFH